MPDINMRSSATKIKGQGVGSCYQEQVRLVSRGLSKSFGVYTNTLRNCDIIHYHTIDPHYFIERLLNKNKTIGICSVHFLPDTIEDSLRMPKLFKHVFYRYILTFYNSMDYLVAVNPVTIKKLRQYNITKPKICYIPNYVSEEEFYVMPDSEIKKARASYGLPQNGFVVLGVGQLQTRKGIFSFVETAEKLPHIQFIWAGGFSFGMMMSGYDEIRRLMENPPANVRFLGMVERNEMSRIYNMSDVMFLPSFDELFPMSVLEAISCKKPVLLRDLDIYPDILFGNYLKASDENGFADVIENLSKDAALYSEWQEKSWECHKLYSKEYVLNLWEQLYTEAYNK